MGFHSQCHGMEVGQPGQCGYSSCFLGGRFRSQSHSFEQCTVISTRTLSVDGETQVSMLMIRPGNASSSVAERPLGSGLVFEEFSILN